MDTSTGTEENQKDKLLEWSSLSYLLKLIPSKIRRGIIIQDVGFTCVDVSNDHIVIGTNVGIVYWCNRETLKVTQLKPEKGDLGITSIKLVSSVDYMLAVGDKSGIVSIFRIPKELPKDLPEEYLRRYDNKTEVYTVAGIHKSQITALEWSLNGEKLFSGDTDGVVGYTQMDFYMNLTKSCDILKESYRIVQLSFNNNQYLLVSTMHRSIIVYKNDNWKVSQIGLKDRKTLSELGAVFNTKSNTSTGPPLVYAARNGQRIWIADTTGLVQSTLLFKDVLCSTNIPRIKLLNSYEGILNCSNFEFGTLQVLRDKLLVSYSYNLLVVINPESNAVVGVMRTYESIQHVAVNKDEIFVVEGNRTLKRYGFTPDQFCSSKTGKIFETEIPFGDFIMMDLASKIKDVTTVITPLLKDYAEATPVQQVSSPEVDYDVGIALEVDQLKCSSSENLITGSREESASLKTTEKKTVSSNSVNSTEIILSSDQVIESIENRSKLRRNMFNDIGTKEFDDVVFSSDRKVRKSKRKTQKKIGNSSSSVILNGVANSSVQVDSDSASTMSEIDSNGVMTTSLTSSLTDMEIPQNETTFIATATNEELENQVAKILSLEDVLINPPELKASPISKESEENVSSPFSRMKPLNFLDDSLTSRLSDLVNEKNECLKNEILDQDNIQAEGKKEENVLKFNNEHFGKTLLNRITKSQEESTLSEENVQENTVNNFEEYVKVPSNDRNMRSNKFDEIIETLDLGNGQFKAVKETIALTLPNGTLNNKIENLNKDSTGRNISVGVVDKTIVVGANRGKDTSDIETNRKQNVPGSPAHNLPDLLTCVDDKVLENTYDGNSNDTVDEEHITDGSNIKRGCECSKQSNGIQGGYLSTLEKNWQCSLTKHTCVWFAVSCHKVYYGGSRLSIYEADLREKSLNWTLLTHKSSFMAVSPCDRFKWRSNIGVVSTYVPNSKDEWKFCARDVESLCLTEYLAWYTSKGQVYSQLLPFSEPKLIPCTYHVEKVVCCDNKVWVLSDQGRILSREHVSEENWYGTSWTFVEPPAQVNISDIALSQQINWVLDRHNNVYFNFKSDSPTEWWQLLIHGNFVHETLHTQSAQKPCIASNKCSIWITHPLANAVYVNRSVLSGHQWVPTNCKNMPRNMKWKKVSAEGLFENDGYVWFLSTYGEVYNYSPYNNETTLVPSPFSPSDDASPKENDIIVSLESCPNALWVLTEENEIYIRYDISTLNPTGVKWKKLNLEQFATENIKIQDISFSSDIVWACSKKGEMFMCVHRPHEERTQNPAWIPVDGNALPNCHFTKVFVGPDSCMVWAIDNKNNVYVRIGIFFDYQLGVNWLYVPGILATHISLTSSSVWALSWDSFVYKRVGVSQNNFIGDYWQQIPELLSLMTSSLNDNLYGISLTSGSLIKHRSVDVGVNLHTYEKEIEGPEKISSAEWEIV